MLQKKKKEKTRISWEETRDTFGFSTVKYARLKADYRKPILLTTLT